MRFIASRGERGVGFESSSKVESERSPVKNTEPVVTACCVCVVARFIIAPSRSSPSDSDELLSVEEELELAMCVFAIN